MESRQSDHQSKINDSTAAMIAKHEDNLCSFLLLSKKFYPFYLHIPVESVHAIKCGPFDFWSLCLPIQPGYASVYLCKNSSVIPLRFTATNLQFILNLLWSNGFVKQCFISYLPYWPSVCVQAITFLPFELLASNFVFIEFSLSMKQTPMGFAL